ncbi:MULTISPECIES: hypothetical protein [unclassified Paenibacillus]|nr:MULTISPECIES: hypothetical protein [unclassified Paenibacillus]SIQ51984.1 hypothetical protein SAMN05880555_1993 [Paenibacillus sp. RU4X]SIQ74441.1 hypothetical protein SAMN05880570_1991 [Paenibacillus sp. RU4T]
MGYPVAGAAAGCGPSWGGLGASMGVILVLFILLVIISRAFFI